MSWQHVKDGMWVSADSQWLKQVDADGTEYFIKVADKSVWVKDKESDDLCPLDARDDELASDAQPNTRSAPAESFGEAKRSRTTYSNRPAEDSVSDGSSVNIDLAEVNATLYYKPPINSRQESEAVLIDGVFLPIDAYTHDEALSVCFGFALADGSHKTAELVAESLPKNLLSAFHTHLNQRKNAQWRLARMGSHVKQETSAWSWDADQQAPKLEKRLTAANLAGAAAEDCYSIVALEAMLKSFNQTALNVTNSNIQKKVFGGCSAFLLNAFGPCPDGGLRAVIGSLGPFAVCLVKADRSHVELLPLGNRSLTGGDYQPTPSKLHRAGIPVEEGALRVDHAKDIRCHLSRGFGHVQLMSRQNAPPESPLITDLSNQVIKRSPELSLIDIDFELDAFIVCTTCAHLRAEGWQAIIDRVLDAAAGSEVERESDLVYVVQFFAAIETDGSSNADGEVTEANNDLANGASETAIP